MRLQDFFCKINIVRSSLGELSEAKLFQLYAHSVPIIAHKCGKFGQNWKLFTIIRYRVLKILEDNVIL